MATKEEQKEKKKLLCWNILNGVVYYEMWIF